MHRPEEKLVRQKLRFELLPDTWIVLQAASRLKLQDFLMSRSFAQNQFRRHLPFSYRSQFQHGLDHCSLTSVRRILSLTQLAQGHFFLHTLGQHLFVPFGLASGVVLL